MNVFIIVGLYKDGKEIIKVFNDLENAKADLKLLENSNKNKDAKYVSYHIEEEKVYEYPNRSSRTIFEK